VLFVTNDSIVAFLLPERSGSTFASIHLKSNEAFPTVKDILKFISIIGLNDHVTVIWHYCKTKHRVSLILEMKQGICE